MCSVGAATTSGSAGLLLRGDIVLHRCVIVAIFWVGFGGPELVGRSFGFVTKEMAGVEGANKHGAATAAMLKVGDRFVIRVGAGCSPNGRGPWDRSGGVRSEGIELGLSPKRGLRGRGTKLLVSNIPGEATRQTQP